MQPICNRMRDVKRGGLAALAGALLAAQASAAVPMRMEFGLPVVNGVYINGHGPYRFVIDTGTTLNHLDPRLAEAIGLKATFQSQLVSSTGVSNMPGTNGVQVTIGSASAEGQDFLLAGLDGIQLRRPGVQGVLGQEFLSRFDYLLDMKGRRIDFGKREPGAGKFRAQFQKVVGRPLVETSLGSLVLDSGASYLTLFNIEARDLTHVLTTMTGSLKVGMVTRKLVIDKRTFWRGDAVAIPSPAESGAAGLLPVNFFKAVYVCNSENYVVFD